MNTLIIYTSRYGTTKAYAQRLHSLTGYPVQALNEVKSLEGYDRIIYMGGLYAGSVKGLKKTARRLPAAAKLVVITVGISDVHNAASVAHIRASIKKQLPEERATTTAFYFLMGALDYGRLSPLHRMMMGMLVKGLQRKPADQRPADAQQILDTYGKKLDLTNLADLQPIAKSLLA